MTSFDLNALRNLRLAAAEIAKLTAQMDRCLRRGVYLPDSEARENVSKLLAHIWRDAEMIVFIAAEQEISANTERDDGRVR